MIVFAAPPGKAFVGASDEAITERFTLRLPYIVNTVPIALDHEAILKSQVLVKEKADTSKRTCVDEVKKMEKKRTKPN